MVSKAFLDITMRFRAFLDISGSFRRFKRGSELSGDLHKNSTGFQVISASFEEVSEGFLGRFTGVRETLCLDWACGSDDLKP